MGDVNADWMLVDIKELVLSFRCAESMVIFKRDSLPLDIHTKIFGGK